MYKILFGMIETDVYALFVVKPNADTVTHGHNFILLKFHAAVPYCQ